MSEPVWYRSLYWRIAFGFVAMLAVLLLAQGLLFLWLTDRFFGAPRTPTQLAAQIAEDLSAELQQHPNVDLEQFVPRHFSRIYQPFLVVMNDGTRASNRPTGLPPDMSRIVQWHLRFESGGKPPLPETAPPGEPGRGDRPHAFPTPPNGFGRRGMPRFPVEYATIIVNDRQLGVVAVPANPPPVSVALRELGPTLTWFGLGLLGVGATLTALLVFRPAHKRLRTLEQAAHALGEGRTDVRASETGGDEVTSLARTFNRMAIDLDSRAKQLAESDRVRRQLLADVSHELMTPLSAIRGYVETLGMSNVPSDEPTRQRYLGIVEQEWTSPRARRASAATRRGSNRRCRTSRPTRFATRPRADASCCTRRATGMLCASACATPARGFPPNICHASSIASTRWTCRAPARRCHRGAALDCPSSARSSNVTAARSSQRTRPKEARRSSFALRPRKHVPSWCPP